MSTSRVHVAHLAGRLGRIDTSTGFVEIFVPPYFGKQSLRANPRDVVFTDLRARGDDTDDGGPELTENTRVAALTRPSLRRGVTSATPNLMLLFRDPVDLPPVVLTGRLRLRGSSLRKPHSVLGRRLDGVFLRVLDVDQAIKVLASVNVAPTTTPVAWLATHRQDRLTIPLAPLLDPADYLPRLARTWLAMFPAIALFIAGVVIHKEPESLIAIPGLLGVVLLRTRYDRIDRAYKAASQRARVKPLSDRPLISMALRSAFRRAPIDR
jgi:hypothetical protein